MTDIGDYVLAGMKSGSTQFGSVGNGFGEKTHTMTTGELVAHNHPVSDPGHSHPMIYADGGTLGLNAGSGWYKFNSWQGGGNSDLFAANRTTGITLGNTGSGQAFNVIQPTRAALLVIKT